MGRAEAATDVISRNLTILTDNEPYDEDDRIHRAGNNGGTDGPEPPEARPHGDGLGTTARRDDSSARRRGSRWRIRVTRRGDERRRLYQRHRHARGRRGHFGRR